MVNQKKACETNEILKLSLSFGSLFHDFELQMLLRCCLIHNHTQTHFIFSILVSMSRPKSIYVLTK